MHAPATAEIEALAASAADPILIGTLGPFAVSLDGTLTPSDPEAAPGFGFRWRGRRVAARLVPGWRVAFSVVAAHVPFTVEGADARPRVLAAVTALRDGLAEGWALRLAPDHAVHLEAEASLGGPPTASRLVTAAACFAMALDPCLALLEGEGALPG
jgi:hypothetical protein